MRHGQKSFQLPSMRRNAPLPRLSRVSSDRSWAMSGAGIAVVVAAENDGAANEGGRRGGVVPLQRRRVDDAVDRHRAFDLQPATHDKRHRRVDGSECYRTGERGVARNGNETSNRERWRWRSKTRSRRPSCSAPSRRSAAPPTARSTCRRCVRRRGRHRARRARCRPRRWSRRAKTLAARSGEARSRRRSRRSALPCRRSRHRCCAGRAMQVPRRCRRVPSTPRPAMRAAPTRTRSRPRRVPSHRGPRHRHRGRVRRVECIPAPLRAPCSAVGRRRTRSRTPARSAGRCSREAKASRWLGSCIASPAHPAHRAVRRTVATPASFQVAGVMRPVAASLCRRLARNDSAAASPLGRQSVPIGALSFRRARRPFEPGFGRFERLRAAILICRCALLDGEVSRREAGGEQHREGKQHRHQKRCGAALLAMIREGGLHGVRSHTGRRPCRCERGRRFAPSVRRRCRWSTVR